MNQCQDSAAAYWRIGVFCLAVMAVCLVISGVLSPAFAETAEAAEASELTAAAAAQVRGDMLASSPSASSYAVQGASEENGWVTLKSGKAYYRNGACLVGLHQVRGEYYYFNSKGIARTRDFTVGDARFYLAEDGRVLGVEYRDAYYYATLKPMRSTDAYEFKTFLDARERVASLCKEGDSRKVKRRKAFDWVVSQEYTPYSWINEKKKKDSSWIARQARAVFDGRGGDCHGASAAFGYLVAALGDKPVVCVDVERRGTTHTWIELDGRRYDPVYAKWQGYDNYYNAKGRGNYESDGSWISYVVNESYKLPLFSPSHAAKDAKVPAGLAEDGKDGLNSSGKNRYCYENGKKVEGAWRTIQGSRYYFTQSGAAATGPYKVKGVNYVFNESGMLCSSEKRGTRVVNVEGKKYRVNRDGRAVPGWSSDRTRYYVADGSQVTSAWKKIKAKTYYFKPSGKKAVASTKIKGVNYVFGRNGVLKKSAKDGTRLVKVGSNVYRVAKNGRAVAGWNDAKTMLCTKSGRLLRGVCLVGERLYAASAKGVYLPKKTKALRAVGKKGAPAISLLRLLGKPVRSAYSRSCEFAGDEGMWQYENIVVLTKRPLKVAPITKADLARKAIPVVPSDSPVETIRGIVISR